jgi:hypothetical protein
MKLLEKIDERKSVIDRDLKNHRLIPVKMSDIKRVDDTTFKHGDAVLSKRAVNTLLKQLNVRSDIVKNVSTEKWDSLQEALHIAQGDETQFLHTKQNGDLTGVDFRPRKKLLGDDPIEFNFDVQFDALKNFIRFVNGFSYNEVEWNPNSGRISAKFHNTEKTFHVGADDKWNGGMSFSFGMGDVTVAPFFLRQICSNGMVAESECSRQHYEQLHFSPHKFVNTARNVYNAEYDNYILSNCEKLKQSNVSINEFYKARGCLSEESLGMADGWDDEYLNEAYGEKVYKRSKNWQATANADINGYDFFNRLTNQATHNLEFTRSERDSLSKEASHLFTMDLDLANIAPNPFN